MQNILCQFLWHRVGDGKWSFLMTLNGALAGMVGDVTNLLYFVFIFISITILMNNMIITTLLFLIITKLILTGGSMRWVQRLRALGSNGHWCWSCFCLPLHSHPYDQVMI